QVARGWRCRAAAGPTAGFRQSRRRLHGGRTVGDRQVREIFRVGRQLRRGRDAEYQPGHRARLGRGADRARILLRPESGSGRGHGGWGRWGGRSARRRDPRQRRHVTQYGTDHLKWLQHGPAGEVDGQAGEYAPGLLPGFEIIQPQPRLSVAAVAAVPIREGPGAPEVAAGGGGGAGHGYVPDGGVGDYAEPGGRRSACGRPDRSIALGGPAVVAIGRPAPMSGGPDRDGGD